MKQEILIAGFGGQGVLSMGKILAYAGVMQGSEVSWMPSYGPEMRGGTANVTVVISDERISSPVIHEFDTLIVLNQQSLDKFECELRPGGVLLFDPNGVSHQPTRTDVSIYKIDATEQAAKIGNSKVFNMIVLGAYLKINPVVSVEHVIAGLRKSLPERAHSMIPENEAALKLGMTLVEQIH